MLVRKGDMTINLEKCMVMQVEGRVIGFYGETYSRHMNFVDEEMAHVEYEKILRAQDSKAVEVYEIS